MPVLGWLVGVNTYGGGFLDRRFILVASAILTVRTKIVTIANTLSKFLIFTVQTWFLLSFKLGTYVI